MLEDLMKKIGYQFDCIDLLREALTHPSISYIKKHKKSYERLEFLGDTVLSMVIADMLFMYFPDENEGDLSKRHIELVKGKTLAKIASSLNLGNYVIMSAGEKKAGGNNNIKILENVMESVIGAIYIDGGIKEVKQFMSKYWNPLLIEVKTPPENSKSALQEWAQQRGLEPPSYVAVNCIGPAHSPIFTMEISLKGFPSIQVEAQNKREGEHLAAKLMLEHVLEESK